MNEPLLGGNGGGSGSQTPTGESQGRFSPGTLTRTSSWGAPGGGGVAGGAQGGVGGVGVGSVGAGDDAGAGGASGFSSGGGTGPGYYTRLESLARRKPGQPVRESARARYVVFLKSKNPFDRRSICRRRKKTHDLLPLLFSQNQKFTAEPRGPSSTRPAEEPRSSLTSEASSSASSWESRSETCG